MFEFDPLKSESNKEKHGIDFRTAMGLWNDPGRLIIPARVTGESRYLMISKLKEDFWSAIFTIRDKNIRIISVRKSRKNERELYEHHGI